MTLDGLWHGVRYNVRSGKMTRGPQGAFRAIDGVVKNTSGARALAAYPVELRDGAIWLRADRMTAAGAASARGQDPLLEPPHESRSVLLRANDEIALR